MLGIGAVRRVFHHAFCTQRKVLTPKDQLEEGISWCYTYRGVLAESCFDNRRFAMAKFGENMVKAVHAKAIVLGLEKDYETSSKLKRLYSPVVVNQKNYLMAAMMWAFANQGVLVGTRAVVESLHARAIVLGLETDDYTVGKLVGLYANIVTDHVTVVKLFNGLEDKQLGALTGFLFAQAKQDPEKAFSTYLSLEKAGIQPTKLVFRALGQTGGIPTRNFWSFLTIMIVKHGLQPDLTHIGCIVYRALKHDGIEKALKIVSEFPLSNHICCMVFSHCMNASTYDPSSAKKMIEIVIHDGGNYYIDNVTYRKLRDAGLALPTKIKCMESRGRGMSMIRRHE